MRSQSRPQWKLPLGLLLPLLLPAALTAAEAAVRTISVSGQGTATATPDLAEFDVAVVTNAGSAAEAAAANQEATRSVLDALREADIADRDLQTAQYTISPNYQTTQDAQQMRIVGYQVTNQVHVVVRDLPSLGKVLDQVVRAGSNQIHGIRFGLKEPGEALTEARLRAIQDARHRAQLYCQAADVKLGKVMTIQESGAVPPQPVEMMRMSMAESSVPIAVGEQEISATVQMTFELLD